MTRTRTLLTACALPLALVTAPADAAPALPTSAVVTVRDTPLSFDAKAVTLQLGKDGKATVTWKWEPASVRPHNVRADDRSFDSHPQCGGSGVYGAPTGTAQCGFTTATTFTQTFRRAGVYRYHCAIHGGPATGMAGTVVVKAAPKPRR